MNNRYLQQNVKTFIEIHIMEPLHRKQYEFYVKDGGENSIKFKCLSNYAAYRQK
jgi:hypothetical protein